MTKEVDLFGNEYDLNSLITECKLFGKRQLIKQKIRYRLSENKDKCCKTCINCFSKKYANRYYKCKIIGDSDCSASDIRLKNVCDKWRGK